MSGPDSGPAPGADPFEHDDAAYLLGALDNAGRAAFEAHLPGCAACTARVAALRRVAGALATGGDEAREALALSLAASATPEPVAAGSAATEPPLAGTTPRPDRVAELARLVERRRRRVRWMVGGFGAAAAAALAALVVVLALPSASPAADARQMTPTGAAAISATAAITAAPWGSEITIDCSYTGGSRYVPGDVYTLEVVDRAGRSQQIGSWTLAQSSQARFTSGTALTPDQISEVTVVTSGGTVVLRLSS
jgi:anti-sigma factor RsiW